MISALVGGEWSVTRPDRLTPEEITPGTHWIEGCVGPRTGMDDADKRKILPQLELELRPLCRRAGSQLLYRLSYPSSPPQFNAIVNG
jgi:hypothetical protein